MKAQLDFGLIIYRVKMILQHFLSQYRRLLHESMTLAENPLLTTTSACAHSVLHRHRAQALIHILGPCRLELIDGQSILSDRLTLSPWQPPLSPQSSAIYYKGH